MSETKRIGPVAGKHRLASAFTFFCLKKKQNTANSYEANIKKLGTVNTVEDFWSYYSHLVRPNDLAASMDLHFFRDGIMPMWEDPGNRDGGKWVVRIKKGMANRCWEDAMLALIGDQFGLGTELCGLVLSTKYKEDILSFWNKTAADQDIVNNIRDTIKRILNISNNAALEYKPHNEALAQTAAKEAHKSEKDSPQKERGRKQSDSADKAQSPAPSQPSTSDSAAEQAPSEAQPAQSSSVAAEKADKRTSGKKKSGRDSNAKSNAKITESGAQDKS
jgi:translation initiation factor 4E